jgi:hypothetical protein
VASRVTLVVVLVTRTVAWATTACWLSVTVPWMALLNCALTGAVASSGRSRSRNDNPSGLVLNMTPS